MNMDKMAADILEQAELLRNPHSVMATACATMVNLISDGKGWDKAHTTVGQFRDLAKLAARIYAEMPDMQDPELNFYAYAQGIAEQARPVDIQKLLGLEHDDFVKSVLWLAQNRSAGHEANPPADIYEG
ncbi:MAG: hypothetical protein NC311_14820 [Muribaculaceae bacterium]|nr:hypothetical protein [Muribaculaceae bacterium]